MRDVYQVLHEKELEIIRVRQEIEALRSIIPLLTDEGDVTQPAPPLYTSLRAVNRD
jgi:hypothetical protein